MKNSLKRRIAGYWAHWCENLDPEQVAKLRAIPEMDEVLAGSDYVAQQGLREPDLLLDLHRHGLLESALPTAAMRHSLEEMLNNVASVEALSSVVRRFRQKNMVRIVWRDLSGAASLNETLGDLSELADVCVDVSLDWLYRELVGKTGYPCDASGRKLKMLVMAMGKLGARELNLSSDIDLIFLFPEKGVTDGLRSIDNEVFFTRLARQLIKLLGEITSEGFVFRVDTRLRPFGDAGPLVVSLAFLEDYLQSQAREWERYALIKARVISGDPVDAGNLYALIRPFVYRRYLDYGAIESIREMKKLIKTELVHRGMEDNIKLGLGGIREVEFIGQAFQLIRGGREPALQIRPIQEVLTVLGEKGLLPAHEVRDLLDAYVFLRLTENRLQAWKDEQTHLLPTDDAGRERLSLSMEFENWPAFVDSLQHYRDKVHGYFELVFAAPQTENDAGQGFSELWLGGVTDEVAHQRLAEAGFGDAAAAWQAIIAFRQSAAFRYLGERGLRRLNELMPLLLEAVASFSDANELLSRVLPFLEAIARRTAYLALLVENPVVLSQMLKLMDGSLWIARQITRYPLLLDELIDPRRLYSPQKKEALEQELAVSLSGLTADDEEQQMERLRQFMRASVLRVAAADVSRVIPVEVVSDYLTEIAEVVIAEVFHSSWLRLVEKHGRPQLADSFETGFAVIAYGKCGGYELGYGSDLDLVFLHASDSLNAMTDGRKALANDVFFARLARLMIHQLTARMSSGRLYEVDVRLRPNGQSGLLVSSLKAFETYQLRDAWVWEHQALTRARAIAGDPGVIRSFQSIRRQVLSTSRDTLDLAGEVKAMREKMRVALDRSDDDYLDIKQGFGGIADIEFMVQYAVLKWTCEYPVLATRTDNAGLLELLAEQQLMDEGDAGSLLAAYRTFRACYHHRTLQDRDGRVSRETFSRETAQVREIWNRMFD